VIAGLGAGLLTGLIYGSSAAYGGAL